MNYKYYLTILISIVIYNKSHAFKVWPSPIHQQITRTALLDKEFDEESISEISYHNKETDYDHPFIAGYHADDNLLRRSAGRLFNKRIDISLALQECERDEAIEHLGGVLHTVQDIFSHTNAVDDGLEGDLDGEGILNMVNGTAFCRPRLQTDGGYRFASGLVSGYFYPLGASMLPGAQCIGVDGLNGQCCHRELNKDSGGQINGAHHVAAVGAAINGTKNYINLLFEYFDDNYPPDTAKYFKSMLKKVQKKAIFVVDTTGSMEPHLASLKQYVTRYLVNAVELEEAPSLGLVTFKDKDEISEPEFICDISEFKDLINNLTAYGGDDCPEASAEAMEAALNQFEIPLFNRKSLGDIIIFTDAPASNPFRLNWLISKARVVGGIRVNVVKKDGCVVETKDSNYSFTHTFNQTNSKSKVWTNDNFKNLLYKESIENFYQILATKTGGVYFNAEDDEELNDIIPASLYITDPKAVMIYSSNIKTNTADPITEQVKIDNSMENSSVVFMIQSVNNSQLPNIELTRPNGNLVIETDNDAELSNLKSISIFKISSPSVGEWKIRIMNNIINTDYQVKVYGKSGFGISGITFSHKLEYPNARGVIWETIKNNPTIGEKVMIEISMTTKPSELTLKLQRDDLSLILSPEIYHVDGSNATYRGEFIMPNEEFNIELSGLINGASFQRKSPLTIMPSRVSLGFDQTIVSPTFNLLAVPNQVVTFNLFIKNNSQIEETYTLLGESSVGYLINIPNETVVLAKETKKISVSVTVPENAVEGTISQLMFFVQSVGNITDSNHIKTVLRIQTENIFNNGFEL